MKWTIFKFAALLSLTVLLSCCNTGNVNKEEYNIFPKVKNIAEDSGYYITSRNVTISSNTALLKGVERTASNILERDFNIKSQTERSNKATNIRFILTNKKDNRGEGYQLSITEKGIVIQSSKPTGILYGIQTLAQLIHINDDNSTVQFKKVNIVDYPRYKHRGLFLDVCNHYFDIEQLKEVIRIMSRLKMNKLTLGIFNASAWRMEIKSHPLLVEKIAWRKIRIYEKGKLPSKYIREDRMYGGYYTQEELYQLIRYANKLNVEIIPHVEINDKQGPIKEIYPYLVCNKITTNTHNKRHHQTCLTSPHVLEFWSIIFDEITNVFESEYIHIGGGTKTVNHSDLCDHCLQHMVDNDINSTDELKNYFFSNIETLLNSKNRKLLGWNNVYSYAKNNNSTSMVWQNSEMITKNIQKDLHTIIGIERYHSLKIPQNHIHTPMERGLLTLRDIYEYKPNKYHTNLKEEHIDGITALLWTFEIKSFDELTYQLFPRLFAIAENAWCGLENKEWNNFNYRQKKMGEYLTKDHIRQGELAERIDFNSTKSIHGKHLLILSNDANKPMRYTLDGSMPNHNSLKYIKPIPINKITHIKAKIEDDKKKPSSFVYEKTINSHKAIMAKVEFKYPYSVDKGKGKENCLVDGILNEFIAIEKENIDFTIDLQEDKTINAISTNWLIRPMRSIFEPISVSYHISLDGQEFKNIFEEMYPAENRENDMRVVTCYPRGIKARYIRVIGENRRKNPTGHITPIWFKNPDKNASLYLDEVIVE
ncbi:family 20 glycosylhydrolase [Halosquirtibacter xylanolyticus]|uniref:family 20 glycosylhydrolase n=1 Tax=Halosquirtibacter xylanolyticus TaxID=3374599 RepID=UPI00374812FE|nr:family 20 glycosylhydrolase [Prolixibacteraceae bacterium]